MGVVAKVAERQPATGVTGVRSLSVECSNNEMFVLSAGGGFSGAFFLKPAPARQGVDAVTVEPVGVTDG